jgi:hypothetical protein
VRDDDGKRMWRALEGGWGEVQNRLHAEVAGVLKVLVPRGCQSSRRKILALDSALDHARTAESYVCLGEPALAASSLLMARAWLDLGLMADEDYDRASDEARAGKRRRPLAEALVSATAVVRSYHPLLENMGVPACVTRRRVVVAAPDPKVAARPVGEAVGLVRPARRPAPPRRGT